MHWIGCLSKRSDQDMSLLIALIFAANRPPASRDAGLCPMAVGRPSA
jgi:hypothetical protein